MINEDKMLRLFRLLKSNGIERNMGWWGMEKAKKLIIAKQWDYSSKAYDNAHEFIRNYLNS